MKNTHMEVMCIMAPRRVSEGNPTMFKVQKVEKFLEQYKFECIWRHQVGRRFIVGFCVLGYETPTLLHRSGWIYPLYLRRGYLAQLDLNLRWTSWRIVKNKKWNSHHTWLVRNRNRASNSLSSLVLHRRKPPVATLNNNYSEPSSIITAAGLGWD